MQNHNEDEEVSGFEFSKSLTSVKCEPDLGFIMYNTRCRWALFGRVPGNPTAANFNLCR